jgi:hypothetical protein
VHFPTVITEAPLFTCALGSDNTPILKEVDQAVLAWRNPAYRLPHCIIHIVRAAAVEKFVKKVSADFNFLLDNTDAELRAVVETPPFNRLVTQRRARKQKKH